MAKEQKTTDTPVEESVEQAQPILQNKEKYTADIGDLFRRILNGVPLQEIEAFDRLQGDDRRSFLEFAARVKRDPWFEKVFSALYWPHVVHAGEKARTMDEVSFNRATGNGISFVKEFFEKYERRFIEELEKKESGFDSSKPFSSVDELEAERFYRI